MSTGHAITSEPAQGNRAVVLTAWGMAALAVVRLEGPGAATLVERYFGLVPEHAARHGRWRADPDDPDSFLDDPLVVASEEGYEVHLHGGVQIVQRLLDQAAEAGFEVMRGEEAMAAVASDELDAALPHVMTEAGLRILLAQPAAWKVLDPETVDVGKLLADHTLERLIHPATVALIGAANVGKSTLANFLFKEERSIVADQPGTTRDWVGHLVEIGGLPVTLIDTPGRRPSEDAIEQQAIRQSAGLVERADVVVLMVDATRPREAPSGFEGALRVANKSDLADPPADCVPIVATTGAGVAALTHRIHERLGVNVSEVDRARIWTARQRQLIEAKGREGLHALRQQIVSAHPRHGVPRLRFDYHRQP